MNKSLFLLTNIFKNVSLFACFVDFRMLYYMYITINNNMTKNDIKSLLVAAAIVLFGYGLMYGFHYFADFLGIYESLRY
jgi:hypothetical protein